MIDLSRPRISARRNAGRSNNHRRFLLIARHTLAEQAINGEGPGTPDQDGYRRADRQQMLLKSLAFLLIKPVHVKATQSVDQSANQLGAEPRTTQAISTLLLDVSGD